MIIRVVHFDCWEFGKHSKVKKLKLHVCLYFFVTTELGSCYIYHPVFSLHCSTLYI